MFLWSVLVPFVAIALYLGLRRAGIPRKDESRIRQAPLLGLAVAMGAIVWMGCASGDWNMSLLAGTWMCIAAVVVFFFMTALGLGTIHVFGMERQHEELRYLATEYSTLPHRSPDDTVRFATPAELDHAMDELTESVGIRLLPTAAQNLEHALGFEDWSEVADPRQPHILVPRFGRVERQRVDDDTTGLFPRNPFLALVVLPDASEHGATMIKAAADNWFTHRVLTKLRAVDPLEDAAC